MASIPGLELLEKHRWEIVGFDYVSQDEHFVDEHGHIARWIGKSKSSHKRLIVRKIRNPEPTKQCLASGPVSLGPETIQAIAKAVAVELRSAWADRMVEPLKNVPLADGLVGVWVPSNNPTASLNSDEIPKGYRKLGDSSIEARQLGDLRWSVTNKRYVEITVDEIGHSNRDNWAACRKIEEPKPSKTQPPSGYRMLGDAKVEPRIEGDRYWSPIRGWTVLTSHKVEYANQENWAACRKIEAPPKRYREPTLEDLANGPIECEVRQGNLDAWDKRTLIYVFSEYGFPFVCVWASQGSISRWSQCRIEDK